MPTYLRIPSIANQWNDWTHGDLIFMAFFMHIHYYTELEDINYNEEWTVAERDALIMLNVPQFALDSENYLCRLRRLFRIGCKGGYWTVQWHESLHKYRKDGTRAMRLKTHLEVLRDQKMGNIWFYLSARLNAPGLMETSNRSDEELRLYYDAPLLSRSDAHNMRLRSDLWPPPTKVYKTKKRRNAN